MSITKINHENGGVSVFGREYTSVFAKALFPNSVEYYDRRNQSTLSECIKLHKKSGGENTVASIILKIKEFVPEISAASYDEYWTEEEDRVLKMGRIMIISKLEELPNDTPVW